MAAMNRMANSTGMPSAAAQRVRDLPVKIDELARNGCKDVMIYIGAHGYAPQNSSLKVGDSPVAKSDKARALVKSSVGSGANSKVVEEGLDFDDVKKIIHDRPHLSFKLAVESCFSGRWTLLMAEPNLRIAITSARSSEVTFLAVTHAQAGVQVDGTIKFDDNAPVGKPDGADDPPPFTKGVTKAIEEWSEDPANQNKDLGDATSHAGSHREGDRARALGWQHGVTDDRTGTRGEGPGCQAQPQTSLCQPPGQVGYEVSATGSYRHIGPGSSEVCWDIRTIPPRPNAQVTVWTSGPGVVSGGSQSVRTDDNGFIRVRVAINDFGTYSGSTEVVAPDGAARSGSSSVTVGAAQGTCPPP
jgi:hypothetical protein